MLNTFSCIYLTSVYPFDEMFMSFAMCLNGLFELLLLCFESSLYILYTSSLSDMWLVSIFSQSIASIFILFTWAFEEQKSFNSGEFQIINISHYGLYFWHQI